MKRLERDIIREVKEEVIKLREKDSDYYTIENNQILFTAVVANRKVSVLLILNKKTGTIMKDHLLEKIKVSIGEKDS